MWKTAEAIDDALVSNSPLYRFGIPERREQGDRARLHGPIFTMLEG